MYEFQLFNEHKSDSSLLEGEFNITYKGIEAASWYGGRIISGELVSGGDKNPISELIHEFFSQNKNDANFLLHSQQTWRDIYFFNLTSGLEVDSVVVNDARMSWNDAYECLQEAGNDGNTDSMNDVLQSCSPSFDIATVSPLEKLFAWYELAWEFVVSKNLDDLSAKGNVPLWTYYLMQDKDWFVTSEQTNDVPGNLATVADRVVKDLIGVGNTQLNTKVTNIDWASSGGPQCVELGLNDALPPGLPLPSVNAEKVRIKPSLQCKPRLNSNPSVSFVFVRP